MKRVFPLAFLAAAALFLFTGCGYDFLFGGELSVTLTASSDIDLWYNQPTLHLRSKDGGHRIDEVMSSSATGESAWVTVSHLNDGDWDIWVTLDGFADWEASGTTVKVESRSLTAAEGSVFMDGGLPDFRWDVYGGSSVPAISVDTELSQFFLAEGWDYSDGTHWGGQSFFSLWGDFLDLARVLVSYPDGTKIDSGFLGSRNYSSIRIDDVSVGIESGFCGPGSYRATLEDFFGLSVAWSRTLESSPQDFFGLNPVNPDPSNNWSGSPIEFTIAGWDKAEGYLIVLFNSSSGAVHDIQWFSGPFASDLWQYNPPGLSAEEHYLFIAVTDASLDAAASAALIAELNTDLPGTSDPRDVFRSIPLRIQNYLTPGDEFSLLNYTVHRFWGP